MAKYLKFIGIAAIIALVGYWVWQRPDEQQQAVPIQTWETKTDEQGPVLVKATPLDLSAGAAVWKFKIAFDTHSGELSDDPLGVVTLADDRAGVYVPRTWDGPGTGGHHREGTLTFIAPKFTPQYVELKITNVGGIPERIFKWNLDKK